MTASACTCRVGSGRAGAGGCSGPPGRCAGPRRGPMGSSTGPATPGHAWLGPASRGQAKRGGMTRALRGVSVRLAGGGECSWALARGTRAEAKQTGPTERLHAPRSAQAAGRGSWWGSAFAPRWAWPGAPPHWPGSQGSTSLLSGLQEGAPGPRWSRSLRGAASKIRLSRRGLRLAVCAISVT